MSLPVKHFSCYWKAFDILAQLGRSDLSGLLPSFYTASQKLTVLLCEASNWYLTLRTLFLYALVAEYVVS